eukprot:3286688-Lingulodinium_polyedra.AAC.1
MQPAGRVARPGRATRRRKRQHSQPAPSSTSPMQQGPSRRPAEGRQNSSPNDIVFLWGFWASSQKP